MKEGGGFRRGRMERGEDRRGFRGDLKEKRGIQLRGGRGKVLEGSGLAADSAPPERNAGYAGRPVISDRNVQRRGETRPS